MSEKYKSLPLCARLLIGAYRLLTELSQPLLRLHLLRRHVGGIKEHNDVARRNERWGFSVQRFAEAEVKAQRKVQTLWFHAASVGESLSILPVVKRIREQYDDSHVRILLTCCTVTADKILSEKLKGTSIIHQFSPLDHPSAVNRFLDHWQPTTAIWLESELWPNLIMETSKRKIPMLLVNARMSDNSFARWSHNPCFKAIAQFLLGHFDEIFAQSDKDKGKLANLGVQSENVGNLKYAKPYLALVDVERSVSVENNVGQRPAWIVASSHSLEEQDILKAHQILKKLHPDVLTVIAPRHPERGIDIHAECQSRMLSSGLRSSGQNISDETEIYILDTVGELLSYYDALNVVFVGGSLHPSYGGHNPIEPAFLHNLVIHGPHTSNFSQVYDSIAQHTLKASDGESLAQAVSYAFHLQRDCPQEFQQSCQSLYDIVCRHIKAEDAIYKLICRVAQLESIV